MAASIKATQQQVVAVGEKFEETKRALKQANLAPDDKQILMMELKSLMDEKAKLMDEKAKLVDKEKGLMDEKAKLMDKEKGLMDEKKGLMDEKAKLMDKEKGLMDEKAKLMDENKSLMTGLSFTPWLDEVFPAAKYKPSPLCVDPRKHAGMLNTKEDTGCVIDDPWYTMAHPLLDFDVDKACDVVLAAAASLRSGRFKPVVAIARGMGGGKTRSMEEIRRRLMLQPGVLPIAITFNNFSPAGEDSLLEPWLVKKFSPGRMYALAVAARIVSAGLGAKYRVTSAAFAKSLDGLDLDSAEVETLIIKEAVTWLVGRVNESRPANASICTFVLLLDEGGKADEAIKATDMGRLVRSALLDDNIAGLNTALVISDLAFLPEALRRPVSFRTVKHLKLPARLSDKQVVSEWWCPGKTLSGEQRGLLELAAKALANTPRALEIAADFLHVAERSGREVSATLVADMFAEVLEEVKTKYDPLPPPLSVLTSIFFREPISLEAPGLLEACVKSVVTNSVTDFRGGRTMVPDASLVLLRVAARNEPLGSSMSLIGEGVDCVIKTMTSPPNSTSKSRPLGDMLEEAGLQALRCRLQLARSVEGITLARLCGVNSALVVDKSKLGLQLTEFADKVNPATAASMLFAPLDLAAFDYDGAVDRLSACSQGTKMNTAGFLAELDALEVSKRRPVRLIRPTKGESWDLCVKALNPATGGAFCFFFDDKSRTEFDEGKTPLTLDEVTNHQKQYLHTKAVLGPSRPFLYVYRSTYVDLLSQVLPAADAAETALPSRCMVLGREDTLALLGPFAEIYQAARAAGGMDFDSRNKAKRRADPRVKLAGPRSGRGRRGEEGGKKKKGPKSLP